METSGLPWREVRFITDRDDDGDPIWDNQRVEITFNYGDATAQVVIWAPGTMRARKDGTIQSLPLGEIAARVEGRVIRGPIDPTTWDQIVRLLKQEGHLCPTS